MTDRELLEMAAKAAGTKKDDSPYNGGGEGNDGFDCMGNMVTDWHNNKLWNPLTDDGDALRLAASIGSLCINIDQKGFVDVIADAGDSSHRELFDTTSEKLSAIRRAIVRAAAEIGRYRVPQKPSPIGSNEA